MAPNFSNMDAQAVDQLALDLVNIGAPDWYIHPKFSVIYAGEFDAINAANPLTYAAGLLHALSQDKPPPASFFSALPKPKGKFWAVYAGLLTRPDHRPKIVIGSGTNSSWGASTRMTHYKDKKHQSLPRFVRQAYDNGWSLAHMGCLAWGSIPPASAVPRGRVRYVAQEALWTNIFFTGNVSIMDPLWVHLMPWKRDQVEWDWLNSHTPLNESPEGDMNLSPAELAVLDDKRKTRRTAKMKVLNKKYKDLMNMHIRKEMNEAADFKNRNQVELDKIDSYMVDGNKAVFVPIKDRPSTKRKVPAPTTAATLTQKRCLDKAKAEKKYYCPICSYAAGTPAYLGHHFTSAHHKKNLARAAAGAAKALAKAK
jgi:hypothetical protein